MATVAETAPRARELFAGLDVNTWLVSHSMGAPPLAARDALTRYYAEWADRGPEAWAGWLAEVRAIADGIGGLFGAPPGSVYLAPNVSTLQSAIASATAFPSERNEVVYESLQFPSLAYVWTAWERMGAVTRCVPSDDGRTIPTERIVAAITPKTAVIVLSHAYYQSAALVDVPAIVARAKETGTLLVLDAYQTAGIVPFDVTSLDADIVVGGSHKWLCGGPGCGYIYVKPAIARDFSPAVTGWFAHADQWAFAAPPMRYAPDPARWATGTPTIPGYLVARAGHAIVGEIGVPAIRAHSNRLTARITEAARERGLSVNSPLDPLRRTGWVGIDVPGAAGIVDQLNARRVFVDYRPGCGIRVSAHFYTSDDDVARFFAELDDLRY
ncbi:MAG: aminotransferase class V-fold PLP-dependent enzyme [Candidatus Velthaea sp.]